MAAALELENSGDFEVVQIWSGTDVGVPGLLGAMLFSDDGAILYVVGDCEQPDSNRSVKAMAYRGSTVSPCYVLSVLLAVEAACT